MGVSRSVNPVSSSKRTDITFWKQEYGARCWRTAVGYEAGKEVVTIVDMSFFSQSSVSDGLLLRISSSSASGNLATTRPKYHKRPQCQSAL
jgi:hypothetical protein